MVIDPNLVVYAVTIAVFLLGALIVMGSALAIAVVSTLWVGLARVCRRIWRPKHQPEPPESPDAATTEAVTIEVLLRGEDAGTELLPITGLAETGTIGWRNRSSS